MPFLNKYLIQNTKRLINLIFNYLEIHFFGHEQKEIANAEVK